MRPARSESTPVTSVIPASNTTMRRLDVAVALVEARAARVKPACARRVDRARHVALEHDPPPLPADLGIRDRDGGEERARIRVLRLRVEAVPRSDLHGVTEVHDHDAVGDVANDV